MQSRHQILFYTISILLLINFSKSLEADLIEGKKCSSNDDCNPPFEICNMKKGVCKHKNLFPMECKSNQGKIFFAFY